MPHNFIKSITYFFISIKNFDETLLRKVLNKGMLQSGACWEWSFYWTLFIYTR